MKPEKLFWADISRFLVNNRTIILAMLHSELNNKLGTIYDCQF